MTAASRTHQMQELTPDQSRMLLEERVQRRLGIDLPEFIRRWHTGFYDDPDDNPDALELAVLLPIVGVDPWRNGAST
ncbi:MAG: hypothetical protein AB7R89_26550 [Dehalococcoidia bacterium]